MGGLTCCGNLFYSLVNYSGIFIVIFLTDKLQHQNNATFILIESFLFALFAPHCAKLGSGLTLSEKTGPGFA